MGTPLPGNEPTTGCALCFGTDKPLGLVQPRFIWLDFSGVKPGPGADLIQGILPSGKWLVAQVSGCLYRVNYPLWIIELLWGSSSTIVRWRDAFGGLLFNSSLNFIVCGTSIANKVGYTPTIAAYGGNCEITWSDGGL